MTEEKCTACSVDHTSSGKNRWVAIPSCGTQTKWTGAIPGDVSVKADSGVVTVTITGPSTAWFGVGFNAVTMANAPYTITVNSTGVTERKIGTCGSEAEHCPGTVLASSIKVVSNTVVDGKRTVVVTRPSAGATKDHYTFSEPTFNYISAQGWDQKFAQHKVHDSLTISLMEPTGPTCVCTTGTTGQLCEFNGTACGKFAKNCAPHSSTLGNKGESSGSLLIQRVSTLTKAIHTTSLFWGCF